jgi:hypothetical protein
MTQNSNFSAAKYIFWQKIIEIVNLPLRTKIPITVLCTEMDAAKKLLKQQRYRQKRRFELESLILASTQVAGKHCETRPTTVAERALITVAKQRPDTDIRPQNGV